MCGLTGFYSVNPTLSKVEQNVIGKKMAETITHRGPDNGGIWQEPELGLLLAHRRLSILDLTSEGHQPMSSHSNRYVITYNGEIYNHLEIRAQLEHTGHRFNGRSDTETLLSAIEHWGINRALQKINGMFAFVLWDKNERTLHFVRDRLGKKPLYIGWAGKGQKSSLIFASELKALRAHPDFAANINPSAMEQYSRFGFIQSPETIYRNIWQLPPAARLSLHLNELSSGEDLRPKFQPYWNAAEQADIAKTSPVQKSEELIIDDFENHLKRAVRERMISDVPLGAFLSGGIDSSLITAIMQNISLDPVKTYSIGFEQDGYNEAEHAKTIAKHLGTEHQEHYCSAADAKDVIPLLANMYDEPFSDQSAIPTHLLSLMTKSDVTVALSGDGGDELMGGYTRHIQSSSLKKAQAYSPYFLRRLISMGIETIPANQLEKLNSKNPNFAKHLRKIAAILSTKSDEGFYQKMLENHDGSLLKSDTYNGLELSDTQSLSFTEQIILWDTLFYLPNSVLTKVDRASMACALEVRAPLLDYKLFEYSWSLPLSMKIRGNDGKYILKKTLERHVPKELFDRPKQGFNIPLNHWLKNDLKDWAEDLLNQDSLKSHDLYNEIRVQEEWSNFKSGKTENTSLIWSILMFQAWYKHWM
tara:strand:- start:1283 stop:3214 length:1932 start_codon:yes stop_codon:yes gene_type:complete